MLRARQYVPFLRSGRFTHFLVSGGGNDVLGHLGLLNPLNFSFTDPNDPGRALHQAGVPDRARRTANSTAR